MTPGLSASPRLWHNLEVERGGVRGCWVPRAATTRGEAEPCSRAGGLIQVLVGTAAGVIQLVTRCASAEEFIERFARYTTATDVVVPALPNLTVGTAGPFVICLKDRTVTWKGRCEVTEIRRVRRRGAMPRRGPR